MNLRLVQSQADVDDFVRWLGRARPYLAVDTETSGLDWLREDLRMVQFGDAEAGWALPYPEQRHLIANVLSLYPEQTVYHNAKFDLHFLRAAGLDPNVKADDTRIMLGLAGAESLHLKDAGWEVAGGASLPQSRLRTMMKENKWGWGDIPKDLPEYWQYAAFDAVLTARLAEKYRGLVPDRLYEVEQRVWQAMLGAEERGFLVDLDYCRAKAAQLQDQTEGIQAQWDILLSSPKQVGEALIRKGHRLPKTGTGRSSTSEEVLAEIDDPLARAVLEYRDLAKQLGTYFQAYLELADEDDRIHTTINTMGAKTGRMSSERPNMQNVPHSSFVRNAFMASPGCTLVSVDYSQIEYRLLAILAKEPRMIEAFLSGQDFHDMTAEMLGTSRDIAKTTNYAQVYEAGDVKFAKTAHVSVSQAHAFKEQYDEAFPGIAQFKDGFKKYVMDNGWRVTLDSGRNIPVERERLYAGLNYEIQGTAADTLKEAIVRVDDSEWGQYFILPVHDELVFDIPDELVERAVEELPEIMEVRGVYPIPLTVDVHWSQRWGHKYEEE